MPSGTSLRGKSTTPAFGCRSAASSARNAPGEPKRRTERETVRPSSSWMGMACSVAQAAMAAGEQAVRSTSDRPNREGSPDRPRPRQPGVSRLGGRQTSKSKVSKRRISAKSSPSHVMTVAPIARALFCDRNVCVELNGPGNYGRECTSIPGSTLAERRERAVADDGCGGYLCLDGRCRSCQTDTECGDELGSPKCVRWDRWPYAVCEGFLPRGKNA